MSPIIANMESGTMNGIQILTHLDQIYKDLISETYGKKNEDELGAEYTTACMGCGSPVTYIIWSEKYSGYRGKCMNCNHNWPES